MQQQKEHKTILCYFLIFAFILSLFQPIQTYAFGYRDNDEAIVLEPGDILRKGVTYKIKTMKWSPDNMDSFDDSNLTQLDVTQNINFVKYCYTYYDDYYNRYYYQSYSDEISKREDLEVKSNVNYDYIEITPKDNNYIFISGDYSRDTSHLDDCCLYFYEIPDTNLIDTLKVGMVLEGGKTYGFVWDDDIDKTQYVEDVYGSARPSLVTFKDETQRNISVFASGTGEYYSNSKIYLDDERLTGIQGANLTSYLFHQTNDVEYKDLDGSVKTLHNYGEVDADKLQMNYYCYPALTIFTLPDNFDWKYVKNPNGNTYYFESVEKTTYPSLTINIRDKENKTIDKIVTMGGISLTNNKLDSLTPNTYDIEIENGKVGTLNVTEDDSRNIKAIYEDINPNGLYILDSLDTSDNKNFVLNLKSNYTDIFIKVKDKNGDLKKDSKVSLNDINLENKDGSYTKNEVIDTKYDVKIDNSLIGTLDLNNNTFTNATPNGDYILDTINVVNGKAQVEFKQLTKTINVYDNYVDKGKVLRGSYKFAKGEKYNYEALKDDKYVIDGISNYNGVVEDLNSIDLVFNYKIKETPKPSEPSKPTEPTIPTTPSEPTKPSENPKVDEPTTPIKPTPIHPSNPIISTEPAIKIVPDLDESISIKIYDKYDGEKHFRKEMIVDKSNKEIILNSLDLDGYKPKNKNIKIKSNKNQDVVFEYAKIETISNNDSQQDNNEKQTNNPQTSDNSGLFTYILLSLLALGLCLILKRKKKD